MMLVLTIDSALGRIGLARVALGIQSTMERFFPRHRPLILLHRGRLLARMRRYDEAERCLAIAEQISGDDVAFALERAELAEQRGDTAEAIHRYKQLLSDDDVGDDYKEQVRRHIQKLRP